uniref:Uncharacterized protein n=1 Tax=Leviviridae sp. TaxID=2027243 RepID=A0A514D1D7_9VIRU|nr:MAG: hypothetical protein H2RhizoLitter491115_000003 [Leviviridae sp.]
MPPSSYKTLWQRLAAIIVYSLAGYLAGKHGITLPPLNFT